MAALEALVLDKLAAIADRLRAPGAGDTYELPRDTNITGLLSGTDDLLLSGAGKGVAFGTQVAANTLDDYEEGAWTPELWDSSQSDAESQTYYSRLGRYVKIGQICFVFANMNVNSLGSLTTSSSARVGGLPFASASASNTKSAVVVGFGDFLNITAGENLSGSIITNATEIVLHKWDLATGTTDLTIAEYSSGGNITFSAAYKAA